MLTLGLIASVGLATIAPFVVDSINDTAAAFMIGLLGMLLLAAIGLASLSTLREQLRRLSIAVIDWKYRGFVLILLLAILIGVLATIANGRSESWVKSSAVPRATISLFTFCLVFSVVYSIWIWQRVSSPEWVLATALYKVAHIVHITMRQRKPNETLSWFRFLLQTGKTVNPGSEKQLVLLAFYGTAEAVLDMNWNPRSNELMRRVVVYIDEVVRGGEVPGNALNTTSALNELHYLYNVGTEVWGECPFDYGRFTRAMTRLTTFAAERHFLNVVRRGTTNLMQIAERELGRGSRSLSSPIEISSCLEAIGKVCVRTGYLGDALHVVTILLCLTKTAKEVGSVSSGIPHKILFSALSVCASIWGSEPHAKAILDPLLVDELHVVLPEIPAAVEYGKQLNGITASKVEGVLRHVSVV